MCQRASTDRDLDTGNPVPVQQKGKTKPDYYEAIIIIMMPKCKCKCTSSQKAPAVNKCNSTTVNEASQSRRLRR